VVLDLLPIRALVMMKMLLPLPFPLMALTTTLVAVPFAAACAGPFWTNIRNTRKRIMSLQLLQLPYLNKDGQDNADSTNNNSNSTFCGSLRDVFLDEPPQPDEKRNVITPRVATREKDRQDNDNDEEVMSDVWKDLTLYEDYKPPIPRVIETNIPSPTATVASPKHKKNRRRNKSKNNSKNISGNGKDNNNHTSPTKTNYKDDSDQQQQQQRQQHQHVDEDESLMGLDLLNGEEIQKDFELPRSQAVLNTTAATTSSSELHRQDIFWSGVKAPPVAAAAAAPTDGIRGEATDAKPYVRYSSTHSWTYSLTTCDAGGSSRSTGLGGGGDGGGGDDASPGSSSWSDNDFVDINEHGTTNSIDALFLVASSSSNGRDTGGLRPTLAAAGCAGEVDDHDGSIHSGDKVSSLLLRSVGVAGTNASSVQPPSKITAKTISPRATKRATPTTTLASPFIFHGHHNQPQPLLLTASSPPPSQSPPPPQQQQQQQLKPQQFRTMNSHNSGTLTTRSTSMSDSATLNCSSTLATHDDDTAEGNIVRIDTTDVLPSNRLYHHMERDQESLVDEDIGEEVETASI
jgi:hypothetical protein